MDTNSLSNRFLLVLKKQQLLQMAASTSRIQKKTLKGCALDGIPIPYCRQNLFFESFRENSLVTKRRNTSNHTNIRTGSPILKI